MRTEKSCGAVVFRNKNDNIQVLLIQIASEQNDILLGKGGENGVAADFLRNAGYVGKPIFPGFLSDDFHCVSPLI